MPDSDLVLGYWREVHDRPVSEIAVIVWPGSGHFPHIAFPGRFAECLAATAHPSGQTEGNEQRA